MSILAPIIGLQYIPTMQAPNPYSFSGSIGVHSPSNATRVVATFTGTPPTGLSLIITDISGTSTLVVVVYGVPTDAPGVYTWGVHLTDPVSGEALNLTPIVTTVLSPIVSPTLRVVPLAIHLYSRMYLSYRTGPPISTPGDSWNLAGVYTENPGNITSGCQREDDISLIQSEGSTSALSYLRNGYPSGEASRPLVVTGITPFNLELADFWDMDQGPWKFGDAKYAMVGDLTSGHHTHGLIMIKTEDEGVTDWVAVDQSNSPPADDSRRIFMVNRGSVIGVNDHLIFVFRKDDPFTQNFSFQTFDLNTELWSAPFGTIDLSATGANVQPGCGIVPFANGDIGILYGANSLGSPAHSFIWYRRYLSTGSWEAPIQWDTGGPAEVAWGNMLFDPIANNMYFFWYTTDGTDTGKAQLVSPDGTPLTSIFSFEVGTVDGFNRGTLLNDPINGDNVYQPFDTVSDNVNCIWVAPRGTVDFVKEPLPRPPGETIEQSCAYMFAGHYYLAPSSPGGPGKFIPQYIKRHNAPGH